MENKINEFKQQLIVELAQFIDEPINKQTRYRMTRTIQDLIDKFNAEGYHITVDADLISELDDIRLTFSNYERNTTEENN